MDSLVKSNRFRNDFAGQMPNLKLNARNVLNSLIGNLAINKILPQAKRGTSTNTGPDKCRGLCILSKYAKSNWGLTIIVEGFHLQRDMSEPEHNQNRYNSRTKQDQKYGRSNEEQSTASKKKSLSTDNLTGRV